MSSAASSAGGLPKDPLAGVAPILRAFHSQVERSGTALRSLIDRIKGAASGLEHISTSAGQSATAVQQIKAGAEATARSVAKTGQTATGSASGIKSAGSRVKSAGKSLGRLKTGLGGVFALVGSLIAASGVLGNLLDTFGTAMTIASGVMILINVLTRANPIGFVTGILLPVAGWLIDIAVNSETGQRLTDQLAKLILQYVQSCLTILTPVLKAIAGAVNTYVTGYLTVITGVLKAVGTLVGTGFAVLKALTTGDTRALSGKVSAVWSGFKNAVRPVLDWITKDIPKGFGRIKDATSSTLHAMGQFVTTGAQTVAGVIKGPVQGLIAFANWVIDGLNQLSFSILGKKFGVHLSKIPMLAEGGVAVPGAARPGKVLPLTALARRHSTSAGQSPHRIREFHESHGAGAHATATDLLFLASAHACA
ncbi:tape-measure protein [Streptomyces sp. NPDC004237]|uniref:tape-measure protein n=1 Tax=Streptomyces sp. NPDC004237 TaxID=3154455 RepID=UPI0033AD6705